MGKLYGVNLRLFFRGKRPLALLERLNLGRLQEQNFDNFLSGHTGNYEFNTWRGSGSSTKPCVMISRRWAETSTTVGE